MKTRDLEELREGLALLEQEDYARAREVLVAVRDRSPDLVDAHLLAALAARGLGRTDEARAELERALELAPELPDLHANHGAVLADLGEYELAERALLEALRLQPASPEALADLGRVLVQLKKYGEALTCLATVCAAVPEDAASHADLGVALAALREPERAVECYDRALALVPDDAETHANRSRALLLAGRYAEGWRENEWRFRTRQYKGFALPELPAWEGQDLGGGRLLVVAEQGLGDMLQMARYLPLAAARGARLVVQARPELARLLAAQDCVHEVVPFDAPPPSADAYVPFLSLPRILGTTADTIPRRTPYLSAGESAGALPWPADGSPTVGLVWSGRTNASLAFADLAPLLAVEGVRFVCLQRGPATEEAASAIAARRLVDVEASTPDLLATAALVERLDAVVACDTAVAHLAGALGRETFVLLHQGSDWRWGVEGEAAPWYPTARVFRQEPEGDWAPVVEAAAQALRERFARRPAPARAVSTASTNAIASDGDVHGPVRLAAPFRGETGWAVCGRSLALALARRTDARFLAEPFDPAEVGDELVGAALERCRIDPEEALAERVPAVAIQAVRNVGFTPFEPRLSGDVRLGYTFFEKDALHPSEVAALREHFDAVVGGSSFCAEVLRAHGVECPGAVPQGVDPAFFRPEQPGPRLFADRFVVFSGGKLELRKGQDLVIRAFRVLRERHDDVLLVNSWFNPHAGSRETLAASPHVDVRFEDGDHRAEVERLLARNGVDPRDAVTLGPRPHAEMARVYRECDVGLFPNRCEGGTNLVLMELQASGKPAIATRATGHLDVVNASFGLPLERAAPLRVESPGDPSGVVTGWVEPDLDEVVERLEQAYQARDELPSMGLRAAEAMRPFSWEAAAGGLLEAAAMLAPV